MSKPNKRTMVRGIAVFILLPLFIGVLMCVRMVSVLYDDWEDEVAAQGRILAQAAGRRISVQATELEQVAGYLEDGQIPAEEMGEVAGGLLDDSSRALVGVLRLDGSPVSGQAIQLSEYPAIRAAFRGRSAVRYRKGEGLLFAAPVYHNGNVKYALYELLDQYALFEGFGASAFGGQARLALADGSQTIAIPISENSMAETDPYFQTEAFQQALSTLSDRLNTDTAAAVYCRASGEDGGRNFVFVSMLEQTGLYLVGVIPYEAVAGTLANLGGLILAVYGLLLVLLTIGTFRIVSADALARESDELRRAKRVAEEASESKGRFLSNMSHELRTPINTIMGMDEMILRETQEHGTRERAMDIKSASQILLGLINDVLDFSKIESGKLTIIPVEYDLTKLIRGLVLLSENRARAKSLDFELEISPELPVGLLGDDIRVQQVLTNLLTNAVKYSMEGSVTLRMWGTPLEGDRILLHCAVADTGIGIKPEDIEKLKALSPFTRVEEARNRKIEGSGLGLPIIINLLRLMDSELQIESVYGQGSTFSFDLVQGIADPEPIGDIRKRMADSDKAYEYRVSCVAPRARVLVVDDNAMNRKIFVSLLAPTKIQVTSASSGAKCLELTAHEHFDLIFMDHLMPDMDGVETLSRLRAQEGGMCRETPVIALTANAFSGAQEKYLAMGFDAFLAKPIVTEKLEAMLLELLPRDCLEDAPPDAPPPETPVELPAIEGVNWDYALLHIQDHALLLDALRDFYKTLGGERDAIRALAEQLDGGDRLASYRIRVHALKSTAATVGVLSVSELAKLLEDAARAEEYEKIRTLNPVLLDALEQTEERLRPFLAEAEAEKAPLDDPQELAALLEMLCSAMENMDVASADALAARLNRYRYDPETQRGVDELTALESSLSFDEARELAGQLLAGLAPPGPG